MTTVEMTTAAVSFDEVAMKGAAVSSAACTASSLPRPHRSALQASLDTRTRQAHSAQKREHAEAILRMGIRGLTVYEVWIEGASDYYASIVFDRGAKAPFVMLSTKGGMEIEAVAQEDPDAIARLHVDSRVGTYKAT